LLSNRTRVKGTLHEDKYIFFITFRSVLLRMRKVSDKVVEKIEPHILCSTLFFEFLAVNEVKWKNIVQPDRTTWRMRIAYWVRRLQNHTHNMQYLLLFHYNGCTNAPQCYVIRTLHVLLIPRFFGVAV